MSRELNWLDALLDAALDLTERAASAAGRLDQQPNYEVLRRQIERAADALLAADLIVGEERRQLRRGDTLTGERRAR